MARIKILEVKCEADCLAEVINTSIKFDDGNGEKWLSVSEVEGMGSFYISDQDIFNRLNNVGEYDEELQEILDFSPEDFDGVPLKEDYDAIFEYAQENNSDALQLVRYAILVTRCEEEDLQDIIELGEGKFIDEIEVPMSDIEEEFNED